MSQSQHTSIRRALGAALAEKAINQLGRESGLAQRMRIITPFRLVMTLLVAMSIGATETIADLRREFNFQNGTATAYKPFYMRLARPSFAKFMRAVALRLMQELAVRVLQPKRDSPVSRFTDIVIQDGSSFALKPVLRSAFPGRFKTVEPAAVEVHVTFSGFHDEVERAHVSPDTTAERHFLPKPDELRGKLLLADRGYPSRPYFQALDDADACFVVRLTRSWKPWVVATADGGSRLPLGKPVPLAQFLSQHAPKAAFDLDIQLRRGQKAFGCRLVVVPGKEKHRTWLCTNLPRDEFSAQLVCQLYRFRWQVELLFKEWKSYANLRKFDTGNKFIARGLIWASLAAAVVKRFIAHAAEAKTHLPISTRKVAMCARVFIRRLLTLISQPRRFSTVIRQVIAFLSTNARRSHPERDAARGRLRPGLQLCAVL